MARPEQPPPADVSDWECDVVLADGATVHMRAMAPSDETTDIGFFTLEEMKSMNLVLDHQQRILDAEMKQEAAFIR